MITFRIDRIRYTYPIDRIPDPEVNPPQPPAATQPAQHTLVTYGIVFSDDHYPAALNPRDYIRPVHDATLTLAPTTLDVFSARPGLTCYWPSPTARPSPSPPSKSAHQPPSPMAASTTTPPAASSPRSSSHA